MQALCQWDAQHEYSTEALDDLMAAQGSSGATAAYAKELVTTYWSLHKSIDRRISSVSKGWDLGRMSTVDRNAMRVAVVEMLGPNVPQKVALNEAIEIGREFGGEDSPRFINGLLDEVLKRLKAKSDNDKE